ncbi:hypothetical protein RJT34_00583 [Clitoria ternatea]|uniref:Cyclotide n=1 Tax=Clitoria ternatea TaxID=43366 RepID=A0AAN9Q0R0_CLITE
MAKNIATKLAVVLVVTALVMLALEIQPAECVFAIPLNPCTLPVCTNKCKGILKGKFRSASCYNNKLCFCFAG